MVLIVSIVLIALIALFHSALIASIGMIAFNSLDSLAVIVECEGSSSQARFTFSLVLFNKNMLTDLFAWNT